MILSLPLTFLSFSTNLHYNLQNKAGHCDFVIVLDIAFILNNLYNNLQDKVGHGDFVIALDISFILNILV